MVFCRTCRETTKRKKKKEKKKEKKGGGGGGGVAEKAIKWSFAILASGVPEGRTPDHVENMQGLLVVAILTLLEHFKIRCTREGSSPLLIYSSAVAYVCVYG